MRRFLSVMFLTVVALFMLSAVTFAEGYSRPADCPYTGDGSDDNRPMPLTGKNKCGKNGKNGKGKIGKGGKNGKNGKGKKGKGGKNGKSGKGSGNSAKIPRTPKSNK